MIKDQYRDKDAVRMEVTRRMGRNIPDRVWRVVDRRGDIENTRSGQRQINWLTEQLWDLLELSGERVSRIDPGLPRGAQVGRGDVQAVVSLAAAYAAAKQEDVISFRKEALGNELLALEEVKSWIEQQAKKDGPGKNWIRVLLPPGVNPFEEKKFTVNIQDQPFKLSSDMLLYGVAGSDWQHAIPAPVGGTLSRLRRLSKRLAKDFDWDEPVATLFVLTGRAPLIPAIRLKVKSRSIRPRDDAPTYARGRISLDIDISVTPNEVRSHYRRIRRDLLNGTRTKRLSAKHLALAAFTVQREDDESWETRLIAWNRGHAAESYAKDKIAYFKRDCRLAVERLLAPRIEPFRALEMMADPRDGSRSTQRKTRKD